MTADIKLMPQKIIYHLNLLEKHVVMSWLWFVLIVFIIGIVFYIDKKDKCKQNPKKRGRVIL
ncbi:MAG: hypothetical protein QM498_07640 [Desulfobacterium sp.]